MKIKNLAIATALFASFATFAQKDEVKAADKSLKAGNAADAKATLDAVAFKIVNGDDALKAQYYFILGNANLELAKKNVDEGKNLLEAAKAFNELVAVEKSSGKAKFTEQAQTSLIDVKGLLTNSAVTDSNQKKYKESALKLYEVYQLDKKDTTMLYYAASTAINAQDYDMALDYYNKLKGLNYSGKGVTYSAKNKSNNQEETFSTLKDRDFAIKLGTHSDPKTEQIPSKRGEIYKNISLIYIQKGDAAAAKKAIVDARKANPDDVSLIMSEADLYLQAKDYVTYKNLVTEVLAKDPNNADLYYNLGVVSSQSSDKQTKIDAEGYYLKAIAINPQYKNAYMNLAVLKLDGEKEIVDAMNKLGTSAADMKKYDALKAKREVMYKSAIPYLEKAYDLFVGDKDIKSTLLNMYNALDMTEKAKALKAR
ncbi:tetratricopeptide repeat protein [Flavobacterium amnicola]|uniref:Tetratricopeptide repeat protein n=1 Tax=Flavobacterium amnicola TaxID=2506422 RepID=A0A4Q1K1Y9_9FLAO|nr:tetratricopeptide repeat protein [Flavobacterium amnicola]RXR17303.1 tetratricopeptide repeat protein [Flavobacterium amnicola]